MFRSKLIPSIVATAALILIGSLNAGGIDVAPIRENFRRNIRKYTLTNGIRLIIMKNTITPTVACYIKIGVGSADEPFDQSGVAHFLEHLLFKGTEELGTTDFAAENVYLKQIRADGERADDIRRRLLNPLLPENRRKELSEQLSRLEYRLDYLQKWEAPYVISEEDSRAYSLAGQSGYNAYTSADVTNYQIRIPANRLELWAYLESSRLIKPVIREFYPERKVILEERRMRTDSRPSSLLHELYLETAFGLSPYGKPVIGYASNIPLIRLSETEKFFYEHYVPQRMVITLVGDVDFEETRKLTEKYFSRIPARPDPEFPPISYRPSLGRKTAVLEADHSPVMITGWNKTDIRHPDDYLFEIISKLLTDGKTSRLMKRLVLDEKLATYVASYNGNPGEKLPGNFTIYLGAYQEASYPKIYEIIKEEVARLASEGPTDDEITGVVNRFTAELIGSLQSTGGMANSLSYYELLLDDYQAMFTFMEKVNTVKKADIQRVARTWFTEKNNTTVWIHKSAETKSNKAEESE